MEPGAPNASLQPSQPNAGVGAGVGHGLVVMNGAGVGCGRVMNGPGEGCGRVGIGVGMGDTSGGAVQLRLEHGPFGKQ